MPNSTPTALNLPTNLGAKPIPHAKPKPRPKTRQQHAKIFALKGRWGLDIEDLRDYAAEITGTRSISKLNYDQAEALIARLEGRQTPEGGRPSRRTIQYRRQKAGVVVLPTSDQIDHLNRLAQQRNMTLDGLTRLAKRMGLAYPPKTSIGASKLIEAIKAMIARDALKEAA